MSVITINQSKRGRFSFFDNGMLNYFLPEICGISELQNVPSDFTASGLCHVFKMYLTHGVVVEFGFEPEEEGRAVRQDLITCLSNYWGPDKMIFVDGYNFEVTIVPAVLKVTDVFTKDHRSSFSITVASMPHPINLVFFDKIEALGHHRELCQAIESHRRLEQRGNTKTAICG